MRPAFQNGDVVMVCHHIYEDATKGIVSIPWNKVSVDGRFDPPKTFYRLNSSGGGAYSFAVCCSRCARMPKTEVDYIEEFWLDGHLHVADFCKAAK